MATQDQLIEDDLAYSQAFNDDPEAAAPVTEGEVEMPEEGAVDTPVEDAVDVVAADQAEDVVEEATGDDAPVAAPPVDALVLEVEQAEEEEPTDPKDVQRAKSWEGRLRAREAELAAREKALQDRERVTAPDHDAMAEDVEDRVEEVSAAVESGEMTAEQALQALSADFGDEFASTISTLVRAIAAEAAGQTASEKFKAFDERLGSADTAVATLIAEMKDDRQRRHFEDISGAHPDFIEVAESEMMKSYLDSLSQADRQQADTVIATGSARDIIRLLDAVKKAAAAGDEMEDEAASDAEGVRSRGLRLPEPPRIAEGYEEAWLQW